MKILLNRGDGSGGGGLNIKLCVGYLVDQMEFVVMNLASWRAQREHSGTNVKQSGVALKWDYDSDFCTCDVKGSRAVEYNTSRVTSHINLNLFCECIFLLFIKNRHVDAELFDEPC